MKDAAPHLTNMLGAFVSAVGDDVRTAVESDATAGGAYPAALTAIDTWPDQSVDFLARVLALTHPGAVRLVDKLVTDGLAQKRPGADGRTVAIRLTARGRARMKKVRQSRERVLTGMVDSLNRAEREQLEHLLDLMLKSRSRTRIEAHRACRLCDHTVCRGTSCPIGMSAGGPT